MESQDLLIGIANTTMSEGNKHTLLSRFSAGEKEADLLCVD